MWPLQLNDKFLQDLDGRTEDDCKTALCNAYSAIECILYTGLQERFYTQLRSHKLPHKYSVIFVGGIQSLKCNQINTTHL